MKNPAPFEFHTETPESVQVNLNILNDDRRRVRIFYGDGATGRAWMEENDVTGTIGKSTGPRPIPLLIHNARSTGGGAILDHCIVKIIAIASGYTLYKHSNFNNPADAIALFMIDSNSPLAAEGYIVEAIAPASNGNFTDGEVQARFKSWKPARAWLAFMRGTRFSK